MKRKIVMGIILSCFLLLITPCINAIQIHEINNDIDKKIFDNINLTNTVFF